MPKKKRDSRAKRKHVEWSKKFAKTPHGRDYIRNFCTNKKKEYREIVVLIKETTACEDCGQYYPSYVMDFDHVRGTKIANISMLIGWRPTLTHLLEEIAKCDVVCSNCHRLRHKGNTFTHVKRDNPSS